MRRSSRRHSLVAGVLILAMVASITGLFGAGGTSVTITSPASGARVSGVIGVRAAVRTAADVSYVVLVVDEERPYSTNSSPYSFALDTTAFVDGPHRVFVEVYDRYGLIGSSKAITIHVKNGSGGAVQVKKEPATRVAAKSAPGPASRVSASKAGATGARTVASAADGADVVAVSPTASGRGPLPEPTRTAGREELIPTGATAPQIPTGARVSSRTMVEAPAVRTVTTVTARGHTVVLNGRPVEFDVAPVIEKGQMQIGFRAMFEQIGARVSWIAERRVARGVKDGLTVEVRAGGISATVNGQPLEIGARASIRESRMMVPLRFFAATTDSAVYWDSGTRTASVETKTYRLAERRAAD